MKPLNVNLLRKRERDQKQDELKVQETLLTHPKIEDKRQIQKNMTHLKKQLADFSPEPLSPLEKDKLAGLETITYGFHGRALDATRADHTTVHISPQEVQNLYEPALTRSIASAPPAFAMGLDDRTATYVEPSGNVIVVKVDEHGLTR